MQLVYLELRGSGQDEWWLRVQDEGCEQEHGLQEAVGEERHEDEEWHGEWGEDGARGVAGEWQL